MKTKENQSLFRTVKEAIPVPVAARMFGVEAGPSGMARCCFHDDHTPSLKLYEDHYYCFGCHQHGDVIDLVSFLTGHRPYLAARMLAEEFGMDIS